MPSGSANLRPRSRGQNKLDQHIRDSPCGERSGAARSAGHCIKWEMPVVTDRDTLRLVIGALGQNGSGNHRLASNGRSARRRRTLRGIYYHLFLRSVRANPLHLGPVYPCRRARVLRSCRKSSGPTARQSAIPDLMPGPTSAPISSRW